MADKYLTVTALNRYIRYKFDYDENLKEILLEAEISNFKRHSSGNFYLTLKDDNAQIGAMMFYNYTSKLNFLPKDGDKVYVKGYISVYEKGGYYQFIITELKLSGIGDLFLQLEKLKKELLVLGYFKEEHKKSLPLFPKVIGVITSETGAVIRDIINTVKRRYPYVKIILYPTIVQGSEAKNSLVRQINKANADNLADVLIVGRGGGSIEDLWPFNERIVADAIYYSHIPIISAVGHQTDFTIADFVADKRAATPTAAAELATPSIIDLTNRLNFLNNNLKQAIRSIFDYKYQEVTNYERLIAQNNPVNKLNMAKEAVNSRVKDLTNRIKEYILELKLKYNILNTKLDTLSPLKIMEKGFSILENNNKVVKSVNDIKINDIVRTRLKDGLVISIVSEVTNGK